MPEPNDIKEEAGIPESSLTLLLIEKYFQLLREPPEEPEEGATAENYRASLQVLVGDPETLFKEACEMDVYHLENSAQFRNLVCRLGIACFSHAAARAEVSPEKALATAKNSALKYVKRFYICKGSPENPGIKIDPDNSIFVFIFNIINGLFISGYFSLDAGTRAEVDAWDDVKRRDALMPEERQLEIEGIEPVKKTLHIKEPAFSAAIDGLVDLFLKKIGWTVDKSQLGIISLAAAQGSISTPLLHDLYNIIPASAATNLIKRTLSSPARVASIRRGQIEQKNHYMSGDSIITYKGQDGSTFEITLEQTKELFGRKVQNGAKVFNFILEKMNEQHRAETVIFSTAEVVEKGIYSNKRNAVRGLNNVCSKIYNFSIEAVAMEFRGKKKEPVRYMKSRLISNIDIGYTTCEISIARFLRDNPQAFTLSPLWAYSLHDNAYNFLDYLYYLARQNYSKIKETGSFNVSLEAMRVHLGLPTPREAGEHPQQLIQAPIEKALEEIEGARNGADIKITPVYNLDYKNIPEYLEGYLKIELDETGRQFMETRAIEQEKAEKKRLIRVDRTSQRPAH